MQLKCKSSHNRTRSSSLISLMNKSIYGTQVDKLLTCSYFLCGQHTTTWRPIQYSTVVISALTRIPSLVRTADLLKGEPLQIVYATYLIKVGRKHDQLNSLLEQLQLTRLRESTDPRDKVSANRALIADSTQLLIRPDYKKPVIHTYLDVVRADLHQTRSLDFLGYAHKADSPSTSLFGSN